MLISALAFVALLRSAQAVDPVQAIALAVPPPYQAEALRACRAESHCRPISLHGTRHNPAGARYWKAAAHSIRKACPDGHPDDPASPLHEAPGASEAAAAEWGPRGILGLSGAYYRPQACARPAVLDWPWVSALTGGRLLARLHRKGFCSPADRRAAWTHGPAKVAHLRRKGCRPD